MIIFLFIFIILIITLLIRIIGIFNLTLEEYHKTKKINISLLIILILHFLSCISSIYLIFNCI